jgi:hypothetical protein
VRAASSLTLNGSKGSVTPLLSRVRSSWPPWCTVLAVRCVELATVLFPPDLHVGASSDVLADGAALDAPVAMRYAPAEWV